MGTERASPGDGRGRGCEGGGLSDAESVCTDAPASDSLLRARESGAMAWGTVAEGLSCAPLTPMLWEYALHIRNATLLCHPPFGIKAIFVAGVLRLVHGHWAA